jgi:hypothetical protein
MCEKVTYQARLDGNKHNSTHGLTVGTLTSNLLYCTIAYKHQTHINSTLLQPQLQCLHAKQLSTQLPDMFNSIEVCKTSCQLYTTPGTASNPRLRGTPTSTAPDCTQQNHHCHTIYASNPSTPHPPMTVSQPAHICTCFPCSTTTQPALTTELTNSKTLYTVPGWRGNTLLIKSTQAEEHHCRCFPRRRASSALSATVLPTSSAPRAPTLHTLLHSRSSQLLPALLLAAASGPMG